MRATETRPNRLRIGELAARAGRSVHAIRWYEAQGLIPGVVRDGAGRRVYSERHLSWLELIDRLRLTGMSVAQMREYTALVKQGRATLGQQQELLRAHRVRVKETIAQWAAALKLLDRKIEFYGEWLTTGQRPREKLKIATAKRSNGRGKRALRDFGTGRRESGWKLPLIAAFDPDARRAAPLPARVKSTLRL